ncbi:MAG: hypothetical protein JJU34_16660 [Lunatimonas sp.]|uniref:hypothetical protein n=1 Tax=Lunatimonas sp. TaxID=2060141 RepID=UPI00263A6D35|nr:hypothetical protein [Lunatimonas sp.]MCC5938911.1 hypothetical protein [Lunatimonas sp.]
MKRSTITRHILVAFFFSASMLLSSCINDDDPEEGVEQFVGIWSGTYSGNVDNGTWQVTIIEDGTISGTATSTPMSETYGVTGTVSPDGDFQATAGSATTGTTFTGTLTTHSVQGTWENTANGLNGTWSGTKQ